MLADPVHQPGAWRGATGLDVDPERGLMRRYVGGQRAYFRDAEPWERASLVVDNTDVDNPRIIDAAAVRAVR